MLYGRETELATVAEVLARARAGSSGALVVRGEPGIGKTALLDAAAASAEGFRVVRATGVETESDLSFAALHLVLRSGLGLLDAIPAVQAEALRGALGLGGGSGPPDRMLVGLAVLSLLAEMASDTPLLCLIDDAQWLDRASAEALLFAARRLDSEGVALLFAARSTDDFPAQALAELRLAGLSPAAAGELLAAAELPTPLRYRILAEAAGNPLALLELPRAVSADIAVPGSDEPVPLTERLRAAFEGKLSRLPETTRILLTVAAIDGGGDLPTILRAAAKCGAGPDDLDAARHWRLIEVTGDTVAFRHPLVRAAVRHRAPLATLRAVHQALAEVYDGPETADRRAWHLAAAAPAPDEDIATALERTAARAQERSGAAGAWYARAAELSVDPFARARRLTLAAEATAEAGELTRAAALADRAALLLDRAEFGEPRTIAALAARAAQTRANVDFLQGDPATAHRRLTSAARASAAAHPATAAELLIEAVHAGWYTGPDELRDAVAALEALALPPGQRPQPLARLVVAAVAPVLGREPADATQLDEAAAMAVDSADGASGDLILIAGLALLLGRDRLARDLAAELARGMRGRGLIGFLPATLFYQASAELYGGRVVAARQTVATAVELAEAGAQSQWLDQLTEVRALLAAIDGDEHRCGELVDAAWRRGGDIAWRAPWAIWAAGLLDLGLGRADSALRHLAALSDGRRHCHILATRSTPDLVEAAVRVGRPEDAAADLAVFERWAAHTGLPWTAALVHRCHALLAGEDAEPHFRAALAASRPDDRPFEHARTQLLYGEWLRRGKRKAQARTQLAAAAETFRREGATPWARRAGTELAATGLAPDALESPSAATPRPGTAAAVLTAQELRIVRLAAQGLSNKDIAAQLFLSPRTVGAHLYKAYPKLGVTTRGELTDLPLE
jgi:DNA-binding CsgD family transcriptional regulator